MHLVKLLYETDQISLSLSTRESPMYPASLRKTVRVIRVFLRFM